MLAEKILIDTNKKIVSTDDGLKNHQLVLSKITVGEIDQKIAPTGVSQKPSHHRPQNCIGFKNSNKYPIHIQLIGLNLKSKKIDLNMKPDYLNEYLNEFKIILDMD